MSSRTATDNLFSRSEIGLATLLILVITVGSAYWLLQNSHRTIESQKSSIAANIINDFNVELGSIDGLVDSLAFLQSSLDTAAIDQLGILAQHGIDESPLVITIGRFEAIQPNALDSLIDSMTEMGIYNFNVTQFNAVGEKVELQTRELYQPLVWQVPFSPLMARLIGVDLGSVESLAAALENAASLNNTALVTPPEGWVKTTEILLAYPTYLGHYVPDSPEARQEHNSGGFLIGLDFSPIISILDDALPGAVSVISLQEDTRKTVSSTKSVDSSEVETFLKRFFPGRKIQSFPQIGKGNLVVEVSLPDGLALTALIKPLLLLFGLLGLLAITIWQVYRERVVGAQLQKERKTALITLTAITDAVITTDGNGAIAYINPSAEKLLKVNLSAVRNNKIGNILELEYDQTAEQSDAESFSIQELLNNRKSVQLPELLVRGNNNNQTPIDSTLTVLENPVDMTVNGFVMVMRDVSAERKLTRQLFYQATHDSLTKLANRFVFESKLKAMIETSNDGSVKHAVCYIDLDQFKTVNDTCGHSAGDELLIRVTNGLNSLMREGDTLARLGGDEFGLLITNSDEVESETIARSVYEFFQNMSFHYNENVFAVRASIGFVHIGEQFASIKDVMTAADLACYSAKDRGRNELHIFNQSDQEMVDRQSEMHLLPKLQRALQCNDFVLYCQPIVNLTEKYSSGVAFDRYEILLRLVNDDGKLITPFHVINAAERYNLMRDIDRWVIMNSIRFISRLQSEISSDIPTFSINLSGQSAVDPDLGDFVAEQTQINRLNPKVLNFEITETSAITNMDAALKLSNTLHEMGCTLALDDFGSGMSSFGYLKALPLDYLKIDGQFIKNINTNEVDREMVKCMKAVADLLEISTIAEFVENSDIVDVLRDLNIDFAQGFHYAKPFPLDDLLENHQRQKAA